MTRQQDVTDALAELIQAAQHALAVAALAGATPEACQDLLLAYNAAWAAYARLTGSSPA